MKERLGIIILFTILFISFITIWNMSYREGLEEAEIPTTEANLNLFIPSEKGIFERSNLALDYHNMPIDTKHQRSLKTYYNNRAFPGAPPNIPHPVSAGERNMGANACLKCHQDGGFVQKYNAYAPVTPHPQMINCRQCHVAKKTKTIFKRNYFHKMHPPKVGKGQNNVLLSSPPMIPHQLQMRENCLSCHAGPSAPKEIRVSHPERINCRQCHLPKNTNNRIFKRQNTTSNE